MKRRFTVGGHTIELSQQVVANRLQGVSPEAIRTHAVNVNGVWYPVKQAIEVATGITRADVISTEARRVFRNLGFEMRP